MGISKHTYELGKALAELKTAHTRLEVISNETRYGAKKLITDMAKSVERALKIFRGAMSDEYWAIMEAQLVNDDTTLQTEAVKDMFIALPQAIRDEVERYIEVRYDLYAKKEVDIL